MIRYLLDTNVISEMARPKPDANVIRWLGQLSSLTLPAIGVYEIARVRDPATFGREEA